MHNRECSKYTYRGEVVTMEGCSKIKDAAAEIIAAAKAQRENSTRPMNYNDYEYYKSKLIDNGCYGHERELADALML